MLAAEFHYTTDYIDVWLDLDDLTEHIKYREDCPPIGALFKAFCGGFSSDETEDAPKPIKKGDKGVIDGTDPNFANSFATMWNSIGGGSR